MFSSERRNYEILPVLVWALHNSVIADFNEEYFVKNNDAIRKSAKSSIKWLNWTAHWTLQPTVLYTYSYEYGM